MAGARCLGGWRAIVPEPKNTPERHASTLTPYPVYKGRPLKHVRSSSSWYLEISLQGGRIGDGDISQEAPAMFKGDVIKT